MLLFTYLQYTNALSQYSTTLPLPPLTTKFKWEPTGDHKKPNKNIKNMYILWQFFLLYLLFLLYLCIFTVLTIDENIRIFNEF